MHSCNYCNYKSNRLYNLKVHQKNKHGKQQNESQLKTSYMHDYQQEQPAYCGQVAQQQPVYHNQVPLPSHMQNNSQLEECNYGFLHLIDAKCLFASTIWYSHGWYNLCEYG